ncbi:dihydroorotate dehydrogenase [Tulasnella sp. 419]|nr:dihydroorotate dehydrogenase [Tulasnella sp. 419]
MVYVGKILVQPPLLNSASPWATSLEDLKALYASPSTGAVTTRTATLSGFPDDPSIHQVAFTTESISSINSYGYSPYPLAQYIDWVRDLLTTNLDSNKPIIISITTSTPVHNGLTNSPGPVLTVAELDRPLMSSNSESELKVMIKMIQDLRRELADPSSASPRIAIEINTSCPNIQGHPPPAYQPESLRHLLEAVAESYLEDPSLSFGLKLPPYVYSRQFEDVVDFVASFSKDGRNPIAFFTCTNTLGSSLLFGEQKIRNDSMEVETYAVPSMYGGLAGEHLHPLALGYGFLFLLNDSTNDSLHNPATFTHSLSCSSLTRMKVCSRLLS